MSAKFKKKKKAECERIKLNLGSAGFCQVFDSVNCSAAEEPTEEV